MDDIQAILARARNNTTPHIQEARHEAESQAPLTVPATPELRDAIEHLFEREPAGTVVVESAAEPRRFVPEAPYEAIFAQQGQQGLTDTMLSVSIDGIPLQDPHPHMLLIPTEEPNEDTGEESNTPADYSQEEIREMFAGEGMPSTPSTSELPEDFNDEDIQAMRGNLDPASVATTPPIPGDEGFQPQEENNDEGETAPTPPQSLLNEEFPSDNTTSEEGQQQEDDPTDEAIDWSGVEDAMQESAVYDSALSRDTDIRFRGAVWHDVVQQQVITLVGLGGIGSWTSLLLARMRPRALHIYDGDSVESVNISGQLFDVADVNDPKTTGCSIHAKQFANYYDIFENPRFYSLEDEATDVMICGLDSMAARKLVYTNWKRHVEEKDPNDRDLCLFIDGRMSAENLQVFCIVGNDAYCMHKYETEWLFDDTEAEHTICSYKQTSFCAAMIGGIINNLLVNFCANLTGCFRPTPFMTEYDAGLMRFNVGE